MTLPSEEKRLRAAHHLGDAISAIGRNGYPDELFRGAVMAIGRALESLGFEVDIDPDARPYQGQKINLTAKQR